jgi:hypothetical protein
MSYHEWFFQQTGRAPRKMAHPPIHFEGVLNGDGTKMAGTWVVAQNGKQIGHGHWDAERLN